MKLVKKVLTLFAAVAMVLGLAAANTTAVKADDETPQQYTITIDLSEKASVEHKFDAYQVFTGTLAQNGQLQGISWGTGVDGTALLNEIKNYSGTDTTLLSLKSKFANATDAVEFAAVMDDTAPETGQPDNRLTTPELEALARIIENNLTDTKAGQSAYNETTKKATITVTGAGYYFIKDVTPKADLSTGTDEEGTTDTVSKYMLRVVKDTNVATKSGTVERKKKVKDFDDKKGEYSPWQDGADYDIGDEIPFQLYGSLPEDFDDFKTFKYAFHDEQSAGLTFLPETLAVYIGGVEVDPSEYVLDKAGVKRETDTFCVSFDNLKKEGGIKAKEENANNIVVTKDSKITVEYKSRLNENAKCGNLGNPNEMYIEFSNNSNDDGNGTTDTPKDKVTVFTFKLEAKKYAESVADANALKGAGFTLYKKIQKTDGTTDYVEYKAEQKNLNGNEFNWTGLDSGEYKIVETTVPTGYNKCDDIEFVVTAVYETNSADPQITSLTVTVTAPASADTDAIVVGALTYGEGEDAETSANAVLKTNIVNTSGAKLPETGGIGTTLFYVCGGLLVIGGAILLITKKRVAE